MVKCPIAESASRTPDADALITEERTWSYQELDQTVHTVALFLKKQGIQEGKRVPFIANSSPQAILLFFALFRLGAIACPLSFRNPQEQIQSLLEQLNTLRLLDPATLPMHPTPSEAPEISLDSLATFLFTSGSSGKAKIACHTFGGHHFSAQGATAHLALASTSRWLLSLPLFHVGGIGILFRCFQTGAAVVLTPRAPIDACTHFPISHLSLVPTQLYRLLQGPVGHIASKLTSVLIGGAPLPPALLQEARQQKLPIMTSYGMTEMSSLITLSPLSGRRSGILLPFREIKIESDGEIWVKGQTLFKGYWDTASQSVAAIEGWFPTKDLGKIHSDGSLEVMGRKDRQFISGGENIQPEEIENALCAIPGILQASVLPIDDPQFGRRPAAFIDDATSSHTLDTIREALRHTLPGFKHPVRLLPYPQKTGLKPNLKELLLLLQ